MPRQDPNLRVKNFKEVSLGLELSSAKLEARRCLQCKRPYCVQACPVEIDIPSFINFIAQGDFNSAIDKIKEKNNLPAICGRVCPQENQCEKACILSKKKEPIAIGYLERFVADWELFQAEGHKSRIKKNNDKRLTIGDKPKVAVVGSGPGGLTCAGDLARMGYYVVIFESLHEAGGVLTYGIPEFRLPKKIVKQEIDYVKSLGVEIQTNMLIGKTLTVRELVDSLGFRAVFIATGAGLPQFLGIPGENLNRVYSANEFLTRINLMKSYLFPQHDTPINIGTRVAVIGAGNVAFDAARCALRLGSEVTIVYRRTQQEMPARREEIENAKEEGVKFLLLTLPIEILGGNKKSVTGLRCIKMQLGQPDGTGRRRPIPIEGSEFTFEVDSVIIAIGQRPNPLISQYTCGLKLNPDGTIWIDDSQKGQTSLKGVFAGGDITTGAATVIEAMGAGKRAARAIAEYLSNEQK
jgi:glutamate synthase (NADPH/NADH) small chain